MNLDRVSPGAKAPEEINVIIEIPAHSDPVKYEVDHETGALFVDRFMTTAMYYPCNYGYIPHTLSNDGDPCDVLVVTPIPLISGSVIRCRPVALLRMTDESGDDQRDEPPPHPDRRCDRDGKIRRSLGRFALPVQGADCKTIVPGIEIGVRDGPSCGCGTPFLFQWFQSVLKSQRSRIVEQYGGILHRDRVLSG